MTTPPQLPPAGWYDDPEDATGLRYFDGASWTSHRSPKTAGAGAAPEQNSAWNTGDSLGVEPAAGHDASVAAAPAPNAGTTWESASSVPPSTPGFDASAGSSTPQPPSAPSVPGQLPSYQPLGGAAPGTPAWGSVPAAAGFGAAALSVASYGKRVGGYLIDGIIVFLASLPILFGMVLPAIQPYVQWLVDALDEAQRTGVEPSMPSTQEMLDMVNLPLFAGAVILLWLIRHAYFIIGHGVWGKTVGKKVVGTEVVRADGSKLGLGKAIQRQLLLMIDAFAWLYAPLGILAAIVGLVDVIMPLTNDKKQALHDRIAGSLVIDTKARRGQF